MNVFTYYNAAPGFSTERAEAFRTWANSWAAQGWTPRILTARMAKQSPLYGEITARLPGDVALPYLAFHMVGGGWYAPVSAINYDFKPVRRRSRVTMYNGAVMWATKRGAEEILRAIGTKKWDRYFLLNFLTKDLLGKERAERNLAITKPSPYLTLFSGNVFNVGGSILRAC